MSPLVWMALGAMLQGAVLTAWWRPWQRTVLVDPVGWDDVARRCHDVTPRNDGSLLHHSMCWCRRGPDPQPERPSPVVSERKW